MKEEYQEGQGFGVIWGRAGVISSLLLVEKDKGTKKLEEQRERLPGCNEKDLLAEHVLSPSNGQDKQYTLWQLFADMLDCPRSWKQ